MIPEDQVAAAKIADVFEQAYMEVSEKTETRFSVKGVTFPFLLGVRVDQERKAIRFADNNRLYRISQEGAAILCNTANSQYILARFYSFVHEDAIMVTAEYDMSFEKGVIPFHIISNFRLFERIAGYAVRDLFKEHIRP